MWSEKAEEFWQLCDSFKRNNILYDNLDMVECGYTVNGIPKQAEKYGMDCTNKEWNRSFEAFIEITRNNQNAETASLVDYLKFNEIYLMFCPYLSHHENYTSLANLRISCNYNLKNAPNKEYIFYFITEVKKHTVLNMKEKKFNMTNSL